MPQNISNWKEEFDEMVLMVSKIPSTEKVFALDLKSSVPLKNWFESKLQALATEMMEAHKKRFRCGACDGAKCGHTLACYTLSAQQVVAKKWGLV